jgi:hypothetical protein
MQFAVSEGAPLLQGKHSREQGNNMHRKNITGEKSFCRYALMPYHKMTYLPMRQIVAYHRATCWRNLGDRPWEVLVRLAGFEPATYGLEVRCSIRLSYRRTHFITGN